MMSRQERIALHTDRALEELERARGAACPKAARAHIGLSELHSDEARALGAVEQFPRAARSQGG
jgi:hypothetical protein